jgi:hypothetical protein
MGNLIVPGRGGVGCLVVVGAGVGEQVVDGLEGGVGDGGADGELVFVPRMGSSSSSVGSSTGSATVASSAARSALMAVRSVYSSVNRARIRFRSA